MFESAILLYASHFGTAHLYEAALWLFRMTYSPRIYNSRNVREDGVPPLLKESPVFDWILMSYSHEQCVERLKHYTYKVSTENISSDDKKYKSLFVDATVNALNMELSQTERANYDIQLIKAITKIAKGVQA